MPRLRRALRPIRTVRWLLALLPALAVAGPAAAVDLILSDMTYVGSEAGAPGVVLEAEHARIEQGSDLAHLEGVRLGASSLKLTCDRALLHLDTSDFTAMGNVHGHTADGHRFKTDAAEFRHQARIVEGDVSVDILDPEGTRLEGVGFSYDVDARRMKLRNAVVSDRVEPFE
jgi:LPS export ABC transporter protein LptC